MKFERKFKDFNNHDKIIHTHTHLCWNWPREIIIQTRLQRGKFILELSGAYLLTALERRSATNACVSLGQNMNHPASPSGWFIVRGEKMIQNDAANRSSRLSPPSCREKKKRKNHRRIIRKLWSARFGRLKNPLFGPRKTGSNSRVINRLAYFRLFVEGSTISDHVTTRPPLLIISRWQIKKHSILGPIIHRMSARC